MVILASISARRRNADPAPYLLPDGTRSATDPVDMGNPDHWVPATEYNADHLRTDLGTYAPRPEYSPVPFHPANPVLDWARDAWDDADPWGSAMAWAFAAASVVSYLGAHVPASLGYRPSAWGARADLLDGSYECAAVLEALELGTLVQSDDDTHTRVELIELDALTPDQLERAEACAVHALAVLERIIDAAAAAGKDY